MDTDSDHRDLRRLLSQRVTVEVDDRSQPASYRHVTVPPAPGGGVDVPEMVVELLALTDGAALFSSDDEDLKAMGAPTHAAVLYDRDEIRYWTNDLRDQLLDELRSWHADGDLTDDRMSVLSDQVREFYVIGATVTGDSFVLESKAARTIRIWPHETLLAPFIQPEEAPQVVGLNGLFAWLEMRIR